MSKLRDFLQIKLPKPIYTFSLQIFRFRLCFYNLFKPVGFFTTFNMIFLEYFNFKKTIFIQNLNLYVKCNYLTLTTIIEIFNRQLYKELTDLNCILDVGSFIGESSIYLVKNNNVQVISIEASRDKFNLLKKNIFGFKKSIIGINRALVNSDLTEISFYSSDEFDFCSSTISQERLTKKEIVKTIHIKDLVEEYTFDGLKMDIEGGEFEILTYFLNNETNFLFKKGIIEFHLSVDFDIRLKIFQDFLYFLKRKGYIITLFGNYNEIITLRDITRGKESCFNLLFKK